jgi:HrpA-like RNA helicase
VPQFVLEQEVAGGRGGACNIIVAQPRRVAAVSIARRVADERGERVGDVVGYQVRGDSARGRRTRLTFMTTGVLLRRLVGPCRLTRCNPR